MFFLKYKGDTKGFPVKDTIYVVDVTNGGVNGEIIASLPMKGRDGFPIASAKYSNFEEFLEEWEIV